MLDYWQQRSWRHEGAEKQQDVSCHPRLAKSWSVLLLRTMSGPMAMRQQWSVPTSIDQETTKGHSDIPSLGCHLRPCWCPRAEQSWPHPSPAFTLERTGLHLTWAAGELALVVGCALVWGGVGLREMPLHTSTPLCIRPESLPWGHENRRMAPNPLLGKAWEPAQVAQARESQWADQLGTRSRALSWATPVCTPSMNCWSHEGASPVDPKLQYLMTHAIRCLKGVQVRT